MPAPYFFFRPVLATDRSWAAIDWQPASILTTGSEDFVRCFSESDAAPLANLLPMIAPASPAWFEDSAFVDAFDPSQIVFMLQASSLDSAEAMGRCKELRTLGYRIGLHVDSASLVQRAPLSAFNYVRFEAAYARQDFPVADLSYARDAGLHKIAAGVGTLEMFDWLISKGFEWCDSHFLTARTPLFSKEPDLTRLKLLKLLNLVIQDSDTHQIEEIFREEPKLSYNLLRLVNSVAVGARTKISNFSQAIAILGRRQLQRWLQLLIYANRLADGSAPNPLMQLAAARGRQLELLCKAIEPSPGMSEHCDNAFMTGLFSLLDVLVNSSMEEILKELPLQDEVLEALKSPQRDGMLGRLLSVVIYGESGHFAEAEAILSEYGISPEAHAKAQVAAFYWAARINIDHHD
jgi:EAL and modified HD-GYP domain-containing signal transduction protein